MFFEFLALRPDFQEFWAVELQVQLFDRYGVVS